MRTCENCGKEHDGNYSTRFCSKHCRYAYPTKEKRKERNEKISKSLKGKTSKYKKEFTCKQCNEKFERLVNENNEGRVKFCSKSCANKYNSTNLTDSTRKKLANARIKSMEAGNINGYGIHCSYPFKEEFIRCDSKLEYFALKSFCERNDVSSIRRFSGEAILYTNCEGNVAKYIPDFEIEANGKIYIVEVKSSNTAPFLGEKWKNYQENAKVKKTVLEHYASENDYVALWITNKTYPGYCRFKL